MLKNLKRIAIMLGVMILALAAFAVTGVFAEGEAEAANQLIATGGGMDLLSIKALASAIAIGIPAAAGAIAMAIVGGKTVEGISRQPEADGKIRTNFMLGLVFIETVVIYALLVVILIIFVL